MKKSKKSKRKHDNETGSAIDVNAPKKKRFNSESSELPVDDFQLQDDGKGDLIDAAEDVIEIQEDDKNALIEIKDDDEEKAEHSQDGWTRAQRVQLCRFIEKKYGVQKTLPLKRIYWPAVRIPGKTKEEIREMWILLCRLANKGRSAERAIQECLDVAENWTKYAVLLNRENDGATKKFTSAFAIFKKDIKPQLLEAEPNLSGEEVNSRAEYMWKNLPDSSKEEYQEQYREEQKVSKSGHKDGMPKRLHPVDVYQREKQDKELRKHSDVGTKKKFEIISQIRKNYHALDDDKKLKYIKKALNADEPYQRELGAFLAEHPYRELPKEKSLLSVAEQKLWDKHRGLPERPPANALAMFFQEKRAEDSTLKLTDAAKLFAALIDPEKREYQNRAKEAREMYQERLSRFIEKLPEDERAKAVRDYSIKLAVKKVPARKLPSVRKDITTKLKKGRIPTVKTPKVKDYMLEEFFLDTEMEKYRRKAHKELSKKEKETLRKMSKMNYSFLTEEEKDELRRKVLPRLEVLGKAPKKPANAYAMFFSKSRQNGETAQAIKGRWAAMSEEGKQKYKDEWTEAVRIHEQEMKLFIENLSEEDRLKLTLLPDSDVEITSPVKRSLDETDVISGSEDSPVKLSASNEVNGSSGESNAAKLPIQNAQPVDKTAANGLRNGAKRTKPDSSSESESSDSDSSSSEDESDAHKPPPDVTKASPKAPVRNLETLFRGVKPAVTTNNKGVKNESKKSIAEGNESDSESGSSSSSRSSSSSSSSESDDETSNTAAAVKSNSVSATKVNNSSSSSESDDETSNVAAAVKSNSVSAAKVNNSSSSSESDDETSNAAAAVKSNSVSATKVNNSSSSSSSESDDETSNAAAAVKSNSVSATKVNKTEMLAKVGLATDTRVKDMVSKSSKPEVRQDSSSSSESVSDDSEKEVPKSAPKSPAKNSQAARFEVKSNKESSSDSSSSDSSSSDEEGQTMSQSILTPPTRTTPSNPSGLTAPGSRVLSKSELNSRAKKLTKKKKTKSSSDSDSSDSESDSLMSSQKSKTTQQQRKNVPKTEPGKKPASDMATPKASPGKMARSAQAPTAKSKMAAKSDDTSSDSTDSEEDIKANSKTSPKKTRAVAKSVSSCTAPAKGKAASTQRKHERVANSVSETDESENMLSCLTQLGPKEKKQKMAENMAKKKVQSGASPKQPKPAGSPLIKSPLKKKKKSKKVFDSPGF